MNSILPQFRISGSGLGASALALTTIMAVAPVMGASLGKVDVSANVEGPKEADKTVSTKQVFVAHWQLAWNSCKNAHQNTKSLKMDHYDVLSRSTDGYFGVTSTRSCLDTP
ncbi:hypothetical protein [Xanthomonas citri]|uniref:hypothetical protein n=1 Tax=Xanthomonas citri TaxID=346 RepID=UPI000F4F5AF3|nr:hypothetical protein [Xanthomonas citri]